MLSDEQENALREAEEYLRQAMIKLMAVRLELTAPFPAEILAAAWKPLHEAQGRMTYAIEALRKDGLLS